MRIQQDGNYCWNISSLRKRYDGDFINKLWGWLEPPNFKNTGRKSWTGSHLQMMYLCLTVSKCGFWQPAISNCHVDQTCHIAPVAPFSKRHTQDTPELSNCNITVGIDDKILSQCYGIWSWFFGLCSHQISLENVGWNFHWISPSWRENWLGAWFNSILPVSSRPDFRTNAWFFPAYFLSHQHFRFLRKTS